MQSVHLNNQRYRNQLKNNVINVTKSYRNRPIMISVSDSATQMCTSLLAACQLRKGGKMELSITNKKHFL